MVVMKTTADGFKKSRLSAVENYKWDWREWKEEEEVALVNMKEFESGNENLRTCKISTDDVKSQLTESWNRLYSRSHLCFTCLLKPVCLG